MPALTSIVEPFPFLQLPTELRLQVYLHLQPRPNFLSLPERLSGRPPLTRLQLGLVNVLLVSRRVHDEASEHFYRNQTLLVRATCGSPNVPAGPTLHCGGLAAMSPRRRQFFKQLEIEVSQSHKALVDPNSEETDPAVHFVGVLGMLPNIDVIVFSFGFFFFAMWSHGRPASVLMPYGLRYLLDCIPDSLKIRWDFTRLSRQIFREDLEAKLARRGGIHECLSARGPPSRPI